MSRHREHPADPLPALHSRDPGDPGDDEIRRALADLPRQEAPEGFTAAVLRRLDEPPRRRSAPFDRWPLAGGALAATTAVLVLAIVSWPRLGPPAPSPQASGGPSAGEPATTGAAAAGMGATETPIETAAVQKVALEAAREARTALERLRREHRRLEQDLRSLGAFTGDGSGVIYLGGDESLDLVLDLGSDAPWASAPTRRPDGRARPSRNPPNFL
jgi:hypothetical protein